MSLQVRKVCLHRTPRCRGELSPPIFRLDHAALDALASKRRPATKLGWVVQWGTVRMLGVFLTEDPLAVPPGAVAFVAEQLDLDPLCLADYGQRPKTAYEHAWEIRELLGYRDFGGCEAEVRMFVAARVWASVEEPRALFDRARVHALLSGRLSQDMQQSLERLLAVPDGKRRSELELLRTAPVKASGRVLTEELKRVSEIAALGTGQVAVDPVPAVKLGALAEPPLMAPRFRAPARGRHRQPGPAVRTPPPPGTTRPCAPHTRSTGRSTRPRSSPPTRCWTL
ncbi:DUF4158 domain-containing protein [Streptosporangium sp. NPDC051023]|uniref:DUF4158 domain-containing protein n=1 Tax=Streptosporangium sp. NPDC051023 TaxID=3155410 RepID=UPI00344FC3D7